MSAIAAAIEHLSADIAVLTAEAGGEVRVADLRITDREGELPLGAPGGLVSPNGACRLFRAADGWMALNLAREEDHGLVPAWLGCDGGGDAWALVAAHAGAHLVAALRDQATLLGLPASIVGEARQPPAVAHGEGGAPMRSPLRVVDLSALWAGPLCGAVLAATGAEVVKVESKRRPDPTRQSTPGLHERLNGAKAELFVDLASPDGQARLRETVLRTDVVITSARPRGLASIGLDERVLMRPGLVWVAITGHGLQQPDRVAFGDDAAAAGRLVSWVGEEPGFLGDALADPVTGLFAAAGALRASRRGGGVVDAGLAPTAAWAATLCT
jgi:hypothetical protein